MKLSISLTNKDWGALVVVAFTQMSVAWLMALLDVVYAPIPMFAAAVVAGFLYRNRPRQACLCGVLAGILGGAFSEWAFFIVRVQNRILNWNLLKSGDQIGLSIAEMFLYASLLSFFAAFFSWGISKEEKLSLGSSVIKNPDSAFHPGVKDHAKIDIPLFKEDQEPKSGPYPKK